MSFLDNNTPKLQTRITDWVIGDDRAFLRTIADIAGDDLIVDAYLTIRDTLLNEIIYQQHLSDDDDPATIISGDTLQFIVKSPTFVVLPAPVAYPYTIRVETQNGFKFTPETGSILFVVGIDTIVLATPAHTPRFLGFISAPPSSGTFNVGDWYANYPPVIGQPSGWVCISTNPLTWAVTSVFSAIS